MSNNHSTRALVTAYKSRQDLMPVDAAATIEIINGLQVDLSIIAAWLARNPEPAMQCGALVALGSLRQCLMQYAPPVQRH